MIYLASRSPRRRELLTRIGISHTPLLFRAPPRADAEVDETPLAGESPGNYVRRVSQAKADFALRLLSLRHLANGLVLAADTTLDLDGKIIGKPDDDTHAREILRALSGRTHRVLTALVLRDAERSEQALNISEVRFSRLSEQDISRYLLTGEHRDKAGAYGIQGHAGMFITHISGSDSGIMGLPLCDTAVLLKAFGQL